MQVYKCLQIYVSTYKFMQTYVYLNNLEIFNPILIFYALVGHSEFIATKNKFAWIFSNFHDNNYDSYQ